MSKLTDRSKKDIFYPSTGLEQDRNKKPVKKLSGENTSEIKKDKSGKDYSLIRETTSIRNLCPFFGISDPTLPIMN